MSRDNKIFGFIKKLPQRERLFFLLMRAYENDMRLDDINIIADVYEQEIMAVLHSIDLYCNHDKTYDKTKVSENESKLENCKTIHVVRKEHAFDKAFDDTLGKWDVSSYDDEPDKSEIPNEEDKSKDVNKNIISKMTNINVDSDDIIIKKLTRAKDLIDPSNLSEDE